MYSQLDPCARSVSFVSGERVALAADRLAPQRAHQGEQPDVCGGPGLALGLHVRVSYVSCTHAFAICTNGRVENSDSGFHRRCLAQGCSRLRNYCRGRSSRSLPERASRRARRAVGRGASGKVFRALHLDGASQAAHRGWRNSGGASVARGVGFIILSDRAASAKGSEAPFSSAEQNHHGQKERFSKAISDAQSGFWDFHSGFKGSVLQNA